MHVIFQDISNSRGGWLPLKREGLKSPSWWLPEQRWCGRRTTGRLWATSSCRTPRATSSAWREAAGHSGDMSSLGSCASRRRISRRPGTCARCSGPGVPPRGASVSAIGSSPASPSGSSQSRSECAVGAADGLWESRPIHEWLGRLARRRSGGGWCAVGLRSDLVGLIRVFTVPSRDRQEDRADPSVWAVTCVFARVGHRRRGIGSALVRATVAHARAAGARALEGYPITTTDVIREELHVGTVRMFADAGFRQVSAPTPRRVVLRLDL